MHTALVSCDGAKMSKSLGNLVFIDQLRAAWNPMVIRTLILEHHYREEWEWDESRLGANEERLAVWASGIGRDEDARLLDDVRACVDNDLDTPQALRLIDRAAGSVDVTAAANLLGVVLS